MLVLSFDSYSSHLVEGVGSGAPVGQDQAEADGLEDAGQRTDGEGINRALLQEELRDELEVLIQWMRSINCEARQHLR